MFVYLKKKMGALVRMCAQGSLLELVQCTKSHAHFQVVVRMRVCVCCSTHMILRVKIYAYSMRDEMHGCVARIVYERLFRAEF